MRRLALLAALLLAGCGEAPRPDPPPIAEVTIAADGSYRLDGRPVTPDRLDIELQQRAGDAPNEKLGRTRLQVRIRLAPGADYAAAYELQSRCQELGIAQTEVAR